MKNVKTLSSNSDKTIKDKITFTVKLIPRALLLLKTSPSLLFYSILSLILTVTVFITIGFAGIHLFDNFIFNKIHDFQFEKWGKLITWIINIQLILLYCVTIFFTFVAFANIISLPILDMLSEKVEQLDPKVYHKPIPFFKSILPSITSALKMLFIKLLCLILCLPLLLIPFLGTGIFFLIQSYFLAFDYLDFPMGRRAWTLKEKREFIKNYRLEYWIFGMIVCTGMMIPFLNFLVFQVATVAGTLLFMEFKNMEIRNE